MSVVVVYLVEEALTICPLVTLEEQPAILQDFFPKFKKYIPDWSGEPMTPDESVKLMLDVIHRMGPADSGAFLSHWGNKKFL